MTFNETPFKLQDYELCTACLCAGLPENFDDSVNSGSEWTNVTNNEIKALETHDTLERLELPNQEKAIDTKWIFKIKQDGVKKASLVAKGFQGVYSPVATLPTIRLILSLALQNDWNV